MWIFQYRRPLTLLLLMLSALLAPGGGPLPGPGPGPGPGDRSPRARRGAVRAAAAEDTRAGWRRVVEALSDRASDVAEEAQLQLGALTDERVLAELLLSSGLRSQSASVRERVAEALGRMPVELDAVTLARRISTRPTELETARLLLWTIERQARAGRLTGDRARATRSLLAIATSRRDPRLRGDALLALSELSPADSAARITGALRDRDPVLRCAGLVAAARGPGELALGWARGRVDDPDPRVRTAALDLLGALATPEALGLLVERIEHEPRLRLRWRALEILQRRSGMKYRFDPRSWRLWLAGLDEAWVVPDRTGSPNAPPVAGAGAPASAAKGLAGFPVRSDRVAFLFDFSGSMWNEDAEGRTPKDVIEVELRRALEALPEDTHFNLIPFTYDPLPWKPSLVPATKRNVRAALEFFERCNARGRGNFYDAALLALADPQVDTLVVLTDGEPTGGTHNHMDLVAPLFLHQNRLRCVAIDALLVDAQAGIRRRWEDLARRTGGSAIEIRLQ